MNRDALVGCNPNAVGSKNLIKIALWSRKKKAPARLDVSGSFLTCSELHVKEVRLKIRH